MTVEQMRQIFDTEIPYSELIKGNGIYLFYEDEAADISIGICYDTNSDGKEAYFYNLFLGQDEYFGFESIEINADKEPIIRELVDAWNEFSLQNDESFGSMEM